MRLKVFRSHGWPPVTSDDVGCLLRVEELERWPAAYYFIHMSTNFILDDFNHEATVSRGKTPCSLVCEGWSSVQTSLFPSNLIPPTMSLVPSLVPDSRLRIFDGRIHLQPRIPRTSHCMADSLPSVWYSRFPESLPSYSLGNSSPSSRRLYPDVYRQLISVR